MLRSSPCLAIGIVVLLAATTLAGEPIFDSRPGHPWDQLRDIFYIRRFSTGEVFEDPQAFAPPWQECYAFRRDAGFHEQVIARLEAVERLPTSQMEEQSPSRRLILLKDLWAVFDRLEMVDSRWPVKNDRQEVDMKAVARTEKLLRRLALIMQRLELTDEEVAALPNALEISADKNLYPKMFDPATADKAFLPSDLLDMNGPWVAYASEPEPSAGGTAHMSFIRHRSIFTLHLRTPGGRDEGERFLQEYTKGNRKKDVPPGTMLALLRRSIVPTRSGNLRVSPFVESLQLIVATPPEDHRFKFTLDRKSLLAGGPALKRLAPDSPLDHTNLEALSVDVHPNSPRNYDNGETAILAKYRSVNEVPRSLASCVRCHLETTGSNIFGLMTGPRLAYVQHDFEKAEAAVLKVKASSPEWKLYSRLRAEKSE